MENIMSSVLPCDDGKEKQQHKKAWQDLVQAILAFCEALQKMFHNVLQRFFLLLKRQHSWMHMSKVLMEGDQLADAAPRRFKDRWQEMDTLKQLAYKTLNLLKLFLIDNFTEKHLHFTPKLSRRLMKNSTNLHLPRSVNNHQGTMVKYSPSSWSWMWQQQHTCQHFPSFHLSHLSTLPQ